MSIAANCGRCGRKSKTVREAHDYLCRGCEKRLRDQSMELTNGRWVTVRGVKRWIADPPEQLDPLPSVASKPGPRELKPCGTLAAYRRHLKRGEPPCDACEDGASADREKQAAAAREKRRLAARSRGPRSPLTYSATAVDAIQIVAEVTGVDPSDIIGRSREAKIADARAAAMWIARLDGSSYPTIGAAFDRDHSSVIAATRNVEKHPERSRIASRALARMREEAA